MMNDHTKDRKDKLLKRHAQETAEDEDDGGAGIDVTLLEKRLEGLRDTQESVQGLSLWCQTNKRHSSSIIETWLRILRKSPVEKRLTLFYLANDVIQHAKKKNDMVVVNQWAFAIQKATPHVRTPSSVSAAISRIFKIWEERSVYSKDAIADLLALLNNVPAKDRIAENHKPETYTASADKVSAFQPSALISKVKLAYRLKSHLGVTFRSKKYVDMDMEGFRSMIKDRSQGHEVISEISQFLDQLRASEIKLAGEVEERRKIVETSEIALVFYENVRGEAKIVNSAYKNFTTRVMNTKEKVDEKIKAFDEMEGTISPVPSPPTAAPSPPPDEEEFGVRPANKCGGSYSASSLPSHATASYIEVIENNTKEIPTEPILPQADPNSSYAINSHHHPPHQPPQPPPPQQTIQPPTPSPYDPTQTNSYQSIQQQLQQQNPWSTSGALDTYATMTMTLPNLSFMQQFQQQQASMPIMSTGYGGVPMQAPPPNPYGNMGGYETAYHSQDHLQHHHATPPLPPPPPSDLSSIPLPPGPNPPQPPPPLPQEAPPDPVNMYSTTQPPLPPPTGNPFETGAGSSIAEYDPMYSQNSSFNEVNSTGYESVGNPYTNSLPTSPDLNQSRYHPYNNHHSPGVVGGRGRRLSGAHRGGGGANKINSTPTNMYPPVNLNNTPISPTGSQQQQIPPLVMSDLSPMERFTQSLSKNREVAGSNNKGLPESPLSANSSGGDWSSVGGMEDSSQSSGFMQSQNPYNSYMNNSFSSDYDDGMNGSEIGSSTEPYIPQPSNNIFDNPQPLFNNTMGNNRGGMHMNHRGGHRGGGGMKHLNSMNSRGGHPRGGGGNRGFSGGFRGARGGAGMQRGAGPPRGGSRGRF